MSITSVNKQIKAAMKDSFITKAEAKKIVKEAEKGPVTVGEAQKVADFYQRYPLPPPPGAFVTLAIPETPGDMIFENGAKNVLDMFFLRNNIPAGQNKETVKAQVKLSLPQDKGPKLAKAPDEKKLFALNLTDPRDVARDLPMQTALIDLKKQSFFLKIEGGFTIDPSAKYYGPFPLVPVAWTEAVGEGPGDVVAVGGG